MKKMTIGILAHVDAGKTTLSEAFLYLAGSVRRLGRVDHGDAFLDNFALERSRGITIFSKQAEFSWEGWEITLLDTPGHVDFSAEMERTLRALDCAVLVVSGADGIQSHTETLWKLLDAYGIPVFLFVNKMDQAGTDREARMAEIRKRFGEECVAFDRGISEESVLEEIAVCDEETLDEYMESGAVREENIAALIAGRRLFPCYFGSALKLDGVEDLLSGLVRWNVEKRYPKEFAAQVFKITRDGQSSRLTHMKITGGSLRVKQMIEGDGKVDQIRIYSGAKYRLVEEAEAGTVCTVTGLSKTQAGQGLGGEKEFSGPMLAPVLRYQLILPEGLDVHRAIGELKSLEEEEPLLHVLWDGRLNEISVQLMGEVQTEILKSRIAERFGWNAEFGEGRILYKETIAEPVLGVGHYEPLRHYAEVQLRMEPLPPGSGLVFASDCSEDRLDKNWQRLILTHLQEKEHIGVLAGAPITDMRIALAGGRAHPKHTEGGDFRQATYRAVRQGLMAGKCVLLEPWYDFRLEVPAEQVGRAMADIQKMSGRFEPPETDGEKAVLTGAAPVSEIRGYQREVWAYTKGRGRLAFSMKGYAPCHNEPEVLSEIGYDCERDLENPSSSVFCAHGAGFLVPWDEVYERRHGKDVFLEKEEADDSGLVAQAMRRTSRRAQSGGEDKELAAIMEREFGKSKREADRYSGYRKKTLVGDAPSSSENVRASRAGGDRRKKGGRRYLLVDGYNVIFAWEDLASLAEKSLDAARDKLLDILSNYQGYTEETVIAVFDAYRVKGNRGEVSKYRNLYVVYTKEAETADQYIEKTTHELGRRCEVTVATSDALEQIIVMGQGARRLSARDFRAEVAHVERQIRGKIAGDRKEEKNYLLGYADKETAEAMEEVRLGKRRFAGPDD